MIDYIVFTLAIDWYNPSYIVVLAIYRYNLFSYIAILAIYLEKMVDEMRQKKLRSPDRICFSNFAEAVKSANSHAYKEHVNGRSCYSPLPGPNDNYRHGIKQEYTYSTEDTGRYSSKF